MKKYYLCILLGCFLLTFGCNSSSDGTDTYNANPADHRDGSQPVGLDTCINNGTDSNFIDTGSVDFMFTELLGRPTDSSVTVNIVPRETMDVLFKYGTVPGEYTGQTELQNVEGYPGFEIGSSGIGTDIEITGLNSNTRYYYQMNYKVSGQSEYVTGEERTFHTQRAPGSTFTFTVQSDSHINLIDPDVIGGNTGKLENYNQTLANQGTDTPDFLIDMGDTSMAEYAYGGHGGKYENPGPGLVEKWFMMQREIFSTVGHSIPVFMAMGNHDGEVSVHADEALPYAATYRQGWFPNPNPLLNDFYSSGETKVYDFLGNSPREASYSWTWGDALFIVLDSAYYRPQTDNKRGGGNGGSIWRETLGIDQYLWLKSTLENSDAVFKFVFLHNLTGGRSSDRESSGRGGVESSMYGEWGGRNDELQTGNNDYVFDTERPASEGWIKPIREILAENGVTIVFHGHDHFYAYQHQEDFTPDQSDVAYVLVPQSSVDSRRYNLAEYEGHVEEYQYHNTDSSVVLNKGGHIRCEVSGDKVTCEYVHTRNKFVNHSFSCSGDDNRCETYGTLNTN